jgi:putative addiction module antidote
MVREVKLRKAGGSVTATLPKEVLERLRLKAGDRLFLVDTDEGVLLTPYDPDFAETMKAFDSVRRRYRNTLKKLAE